MEYVAPSHYDDLDPLSRLALRHGTDKWGIHDYTPHYHRRLAHMRDRPIRLLEIGVGGFGARDVGGESLRMWRDYFPEALIVGVDVVEKSLDLGERIVLRRGSQSDPHFLAELRAELGPFDVIIDDGSHRPADIRVSFEHLFEALSPGGLYVIEDLQTSYWSGFGGDPAGGHGTTVAFVASLLDDLHHAEIEAECSATGATGIETGPFARQIARVECLHNLAFIERGDNSLPSNRAMSASSEHVQRCLRILGEAELALEGGEAERMRAQLLATVGDPVGVFAAAAAARSRGCSDPWLEGALHWSCERVELGACDPALHALLAEAAEDAPAMLMLARHHDQLGRHGTAEAILEEGARRSRDANLAIELARLRMKLGRVRPALAALREAERYGGPLQAEVRRIADRMARSVHRTAPFQQAQPDPPVS